MITQIQAAKEGIVTEQMKQVAQDESIEIPKLQKLMALGRVVIPHNPTRTQVKAKAIGKNTRVKVNVNLGTSTNRIDLDTELKKARMACEYSTDAIMDLSIGGDLSKIRERILEQTNLPLGTVPAYEAFETAKRKKGSFMDLTASDLFNTIAKQAKEGVDFMTVHVGITRQSIKQLESQKRILGIVSRGGALTAQWMKKNNQENPLFEHFDELLGIAYEHDITLSLGDALRPGCIHDATDRGQIEELITLGSLAKRARDKNVQVIIEGPGHVTLNQIATNMQIQKTICDEAPFYILGPVVCDVAPGFDHITAAIGATLAAYNGADFLCYVTPAEHLRLPTLEDVRQGIMASKIAAFSADLARKKPYALKHNLEMAKARQKLDWEKMFELSLDPILPQDALTHLSKKTSEACSMCGDHCAIKVMGE